VDSKLHANAKKSTKNVFWARLSGFWTEEAMSGKGDKERISAMNDALNDHIIDRIDAHF